MKTARPFQLICWLLLLFTLASPAPADTERRIAFVVGNAAYPAGELTTTANDAGLIAQTLQAAGFDVSGARDLDGDSLHGAFRDFLAKAQDSGPDTVAFIYLGGYGLQFEGENYFVPVDAKITSASDVPIEALRISDFSNRLAGLPLKASLVVIDAARETPFAKSGPPLAGGLALVDAEPNMLIAFNAAPGTVAPMENGPYGVYAQALAEMIRQGGLPAGDVFDGVRLRVNQQTQGALVPWDASRITAPFLFFVRSPDAPPAALATDKIEALRSQSLRGLGARDAYAAALERDTLQGYEEFLAAYPDDPLANRVHALLAARREAVTWRQSCRAGTPNAYWSYLKRYPHGPHVYDARRRLATFAVAEEPPPTFAPIVYDVPPPLPVETVYVDRPVLAFDDPGFGFVPPPPPVFLAPPPPYLVYAPPPPLVESFVLPVPAFVPVPAYIDPPAYVAPPPENVVFTNIHSTTIINNVTNVANPAGPPPIGAAGSAHISPGVVAAGVAAGATAGAIAAKVALPPSIAHRAAINPATPGAQGVPSFQPGHVPTPGLPESAPAAHAPTGHELPGAAGTPLPTGIGQKPATSPARPVASPNAGVPAGRALSGQPAATGPQNAPSAARALPEGHGLPPENSGNTLPGATKSAPSNAQGNLPPGGRKPGTPGASTAQDPSGNLTVPADSSKGAASNPASEPATQRHGNETRRGRQVPAQAAQPAMSAPALHQAPLQAAHPAAPSPSQNHQSAPQFIHAPPPAPQVHVAPVQNHPPSPAGSRPPAPPPQVHDAPQQAFHPPAPSPQSHPPAPAQPHSAPQIKACGAPGLPPCPH